MVTLASSWFSWIGSGCELKQKQKQERGPLAAIACYSLHELSSSSRLARWLVVFEYGTVNVDLPSSRAATEANKLDFQFAAAAAAAASIDRGSRRSRELTVAQLESLPINPDTQKSGGLVVSPLPQSPHSRFSYF